MRFIFHSSFVNRRCSLYAWVSRLAAYSPEDIENAIIHGIGPKPEGGNIRIDVRHDAGFIRFVVEDNGTGIATPDFNQGFGLYSVQERLRLMYRGKEKFVLHRLPDGGVKVVVELPYAD